MTSPSSSSAAPTAARLQARLASWSGWLAVLGLFERVEALPHEKRMCARVAEVIVEAARGASVRPSVAVDRVESMGLHNALAERPC